MVQSQQLEALHPKLLADLERLRGEKERLTLSATAERGHLVEAQLYATNVQEVAKTLESMSKQPGYLFGRYGGEEFAAILPETLEVEAIDIVERMLAGISQLQICHPGSTVSSHVTLSIGVASTIPSYLRSPSS